MSGIQAENLHISVLLDETVEMIGAAGGGLFVDCTLGLGGHTEAILRANASARVVGIDRDREALRLAGERLAPFGDRFEAHHANFADVAHVLGGRKANGILADLGVSSMQFDDGGRGFSFRHDAPLDMRMNADSEEETAAELLARLSEEEIADIIYKFGEERMSRRIARRIVWKREIGEPVTTTAELALTVEKAIGRRPKDKIHPATRTFQALRIAVNGEIDILEGFIRDAVEALETEGRLAVITFHSLEDRIVKQTLQKLAGKCSCPPRFPRCVCGATELVEILTRKPIIPGERETGENPRARSAKLRVCAKL